MSIFGRRNKKPGVNNRGRVVNTQGRQPVRIQPGDGRNPAGTQGALNAPAVRNPQASPFATVSRSRQARR